MMSELLMYLMYVEALRYLQEDSSVVPRVAVITVAGLGGIVAGYRGKSVFVSLAIYSPIAFLFSTVVFRLH